MKKLFLALTMVCLLVSQVHAANVVRKEIMDADFDAVTTSAYTDTMAIAGHDSVTFFVVYDETQVGNAISAAITCDVSYNGTDWLTGMSFFDIAGGATPQTSETISSNGWYVFWLNNATCVPYVRIKCTATNTDADDLLNVKICISGRE